MKLWSSLSRKVAYLMMTVPRICVSYSNMDADRLLCYVGNRNDDRTSHLSHAVGIQQLRTYSSMKILARPLHVSHSATNVLSSRSNPLHIHANPALFGRAYSSRAGDKQDGEWSATGGTSDNGADMVDDDWVQTLNHAWKSTVDVGIGLRNKAEGFTDKFDSYIRQIYNSHPYLENVIVPVGVATVVAWFIMPRILRKFYKYAMQSPFASLSWSSDTNHLSYEKSPWSALEDPARYLTTFTAFSQFFSGEHLEELESYAISEDPAVPDTGVATVLAAGILGNLLSGLFVQFARPFTPTDSIKVINNKSQDPGRASIKKISVQIDDLEKIPIISEEIKSMLQSNPSVFLGKDAPYCYLSGFKDSFAELTLGCKLKNMRKDELHAAEQDILLQAAMIIKQNGGKL